ncbi:hypothetical protein JB92DRAFT_3044588 [Gautieria morchelliformis]|nr:hypothetical protein JB92DRAFT_3044588 [Gautieria morchelliformis]
MDSTSSRNGACSPLPALSEGLFVTLTLDPLAMLAPFKDAKLNARCLELESKQYLAIVGLGGLKTGDIDQRPVFEFHLVSQGIAKIMPGLGVSSTMCVPILPETDHPTREALQTAGIALPFPNCYYHSHGSTLRLEVSRVDNSRPWETRLLSSELQRLDTIGLEDEAQSAAIRRNLEPRANASALSERPVLLPMPLSQTSDTSPVDFEIPEGSINVPIPVAPTVCTNSNSSWVSSLRSSDLNLHTDESRKQVHRQQLPKIFWKRSGQCTSC